MSVALRHFQPFNVAVERNHTQTVEWSVKNSWHEFSLQTSRRRFSDSACKLCWNLSALLTISKCEHICHLTIGRLNNSLRSGKLERNRVIGVSMGSSRMMDEFVVMLFNSFFRDAVKNAYSQQLKVRKTRSNTIYSAFNW